MNIDRNQAAPRLDRRLAIAIGVFIFGALSLWWAIPNKPRPDSAEVIRPDAAAVVALDEAEFVTPGGGATDADLPASIARSLAAAIAELPLADALSAEQSEGLAAAVRERIELYIAPDYGRYLQSLERLTGRDRASRVAGFLSEKDWASLAERYKNSSYAASSVRVQPSVLEGQSISTVAAGGHTSYRRDLGMYGPRRQPGPDEIFDAYEVLIPMTGPVAVPRSGGAGDVTMPAYLSLTFIWEPSKSRWIPWRAGVHDPADRSDVGLIPPWL